MTQAMIGFAFNLIAIPLLIWTGFALAEAVVLTSIPIFVQLMHQCLWKLREAISYGRDVTTPAASIRYITLPIGISDYSIMINHLDTAYIKQLVGVMLLVNSG